MRDYGVNLTREEEARIDEVCDKIRARVAKEGMTPRQRFEALWRGEQTDRIPVQVSALGLHAAANYGVMPPDLYTDPKVSIMAYLTHLERFGYDMVSMFRFAVGEKEWGGEITIAEGTIPTLTKGAVETSADIDKVKFPNVYKDGSLPWQLWMIAMIKEKIGDIMPVFGFMPIPGSVAPVITVMEKQFLFFKSNRPLAHSIGALMGRFCLDYATAMFEAGADAVRMVGVDDLVSYKIQREFEFPFVSGVANALDKPLYIIGAGDWSHVLESYAQAGVQGYDITTANPIEKTRDIALKYNRVLMLGVDAHIIVHGPVEKIREEVKRVIKEAYVPGLRLVLTTETLDFQTPAEHVDAFVEAAKEFGRLPLKI